MLTILFAILILAIFGELIGLAVKFAWGIFKAICVVVFVPLAIIALFYFGLVAAAVIAVVVIGIVGLVRLLA